MKQPQYYLRTLEIVTAQANEIGAPLKGSLWSVTISEFLSNPVGNHFTSFISMSMGEGPE